MIEYPAPAASDGSGEGLSRLVRAFFFPGAPSLLVSHWSIEAQGPTACFVHPFAWALFFLVGEGGGGTP